MWDAILIGAGATAFMDLASLVRARFGAPLPDYGLVGRWLAYAARGWMRPSAIAQAAPVKHEALIGWSAHYLIGIGFAALLIVAAPGWSARPSLFAALFAGAVTVLAPFLIMQPGMGAGLFASRTPNPGAARLRTFISHALFGLGLYVAGFARVLVFQ